MFPKVNGTAVCYEEGTQQGFKPANADRTQLMLTLYMLPLGKLPGNVPL